MNPRRAPEGIRGRHRANQGAELLRDGRPTDFMAALPCPEEAESAPMPRDDRFRFDDHERRPPLVPGLRQPDPEQPVEARQPQPTRMRSFEHTELVPECEDFELQGRARASAISKRHQEGIKTAIAQKATRRRR